MDKLQVHKAAQTVLKNKISELTTELDDIRSSLNSATKSSVGDKHETARAMIQLEQERLSSQLAQQRQLLDMLNTIDPKTPKSVIESGSLVQLTTGWFYLSIGLGKLDVNGQMVFCLSPGTPMGQQLLGKTNGEKIKLNSEIDILAIY